MPEPAQPPEDPPRPSPVADDRYAGSLGPAPSAGGGSAFGSGARPPVGQFGGPPASQFGGPPPSQFDGPPASSFGSPASQFGGPPPSSPFGGPPPLNPYAPPSTTFGAPPGAGPLGPPGQFGAPLAPGWAPAPARRGLPRAAVVAIAVCAGVMALFLAAAVVIPAFLAQRDKSTWAHTTFALPDTFGGEPRMTGPAVDQLAAQLTIPLWAQSYFESPQIAIYGRTGHLAGVVETIHATRALHAADRSQGLAYLKDRPAAGMDGWTKADAGTLGGDMLCGVMTRGSVSLTLCAVVDPAGLVVTATAGSGDSAIDMARQLREAVEHRR